MQRCKLFLLSLLIVSFQVSAGGNPSSLKELVISDSSLVVVGMYKGKFLGYRVHESGDIESITKHKFISTNIYKRDNSQSKYSQFYITEKSGISTVDGHHLAIPSEQDLSNVEVVVNNKSYNSDRDINSSDFHYLKSHSEIIEYLNSESIEYISFAFSHYPFLEENNKYVLILDYESGILPALQRAYIVDKGNRIRSLDGSPVLSVEHGRVKGNRKNEAIKKLPKDNKIENSIGGNTELIMSSASETKGSYVSNGIKLNYFLSEIEKFRSMERE